MMTWTNMTILGLGGLLVLIPVVLHFLMQPKPKQMLFPAMRFLKERENSNRSRMRLRHLLLLLMRCLLIALLTLALAGPSVASREFGNWLTLGGIGFSGLIVAIVLLAAFLRVKKNWLLIGILGALFLGHLAYGGWSAMQLAKSDSADVLGDSQAPVAALILIDTSPRMEYKTDNQTRLEVARELGQWLVGQFPLDSQVCVMATDHDRPFFSVDVAAAARRIETLETSFLENPIPSALAEGLQLLEKADQERKEIYVVTDLTRQSWVGENAKPVLKSLENNPGISLFVVDVGVTDPSNFALSSLQLSSAEIAQNSQFVISTQITRIGGAAQRTVKMLIEMPEPPRPVVRDGKALFPEQNLKEVSATLDIRENGSANIPFQFSEPLPIGTYHGKIEIEGQDGLAIDDQRFFTIRVRPAWKILVVYPDNVSPRNLVSTIAPSINQELGSSIYDCTVANENELPGYEDFQDFDAVYLLNPKPLSDVEWSKLDRFVENGGGLSICLGHNAIGRGDFADQSFTSETAIRLMGGRIEGQFFNEGRDVFLSPGDLAHPIYQEIRAMETGLLWNDFPVFMHWGFEFDDQAGELPTQTLLNFSDREPALIERRIGSGRVLTMLTPITERARESDRPINPVTGKPLVWNELFLRQPLPAWMLIQGMTAYLVQDDVASLNITIGQIATFKNDLREYPEVYTVFLPARTNHRR